MVLELTSLLKQLLLSPLQTIKVPQPLKFYSGTCIKSA